MKFFKKHKLLSFAVISFVVLSGVNFYMIFELIKVMRNNMKKAQVPFGVFGINYHMEVELMKGLCFCGGGIKAAAHIGALKAFEEEGIEFDCVSGASSGSIIATMYALGYDSDEMWELFEEFAPKIKYYQ